MQVSLAQVKVITNHTVFEAFVSWLPSSRFDMRALVAAQHGWISSSSVCVDHTRYRFSFVRHSERHLTDIQPRTSSGWCLPFHEDAHYRLPLPPFFDDRGLCRDAHNGLHSFQSRCSTRSSHCATIVCCPSALTVRVNVLSVHLKSDLYLDGIWVACVASPSVRSRRLETRTCSLCSIETYTNRHSTCICTLEVSLRDSGAPPSTSGRLEESFIMHSRLGLACSHAPSHSLCELPPLKPPLIVLGTVVQVFSSLRGLCSVLPWHSVVATPCYVPLTSCSTSSDTVLVLCDACGDWTSGAGLCRRLVDSWCQLGLRVPVSRGPDSSWDSRCAFHQSPPNEFDSHAPSSRGLSVHPPRCTPCWPVHAWLLVTNDHRDWFLRWFGHGLSLRSLKFLIWSASVSPQQPLQWTPSSEMLSQIALIVRDESDDILQWSARPKFFFAMIPPSSHGRFSTLSAKISTLFLGIQYSSAQHSWANESGDTSHPKNWAHVARMMITAWVSFAPTFTSA